MKRSGKSYVKGAKHYESKCIPHFRDGGEVGGIGGGAGAGGSSIGGAGGNGSVGGGSSRGAGNGDVRGTGVTSGNSTGTSMSNARPASNVANMSMPRVRQAPVAMAKKPKPVGMAPPQLGPKWVISGTRGGTFLGIQGYGPVDGAVPYEQKQYYDRVPEDPRYSGTPGTYKKG